MISVSDCIPCFLRHALEAARLAGGSEAAHLRVLRGILLELAGLDMRLSPPLAAQRIHRLIKRLTENDDPYRDVKALHNRLARDLYPELERRVRAAKDPFDAAVRLTIAANVMDLGANAGMGLGQARERINRSLSAPLAGRADAIAESVKKARRILFLADNAGEIVLDRLLIERLPLEKVTVAVRGKPIINDATMDDARAAGLTELVDVIDNGEDLPGTPVEGGSEVFQKSFREADLVIAKGQGNFESLSEAEKHVFFILMVKCPVIAEHAGCGLGTLLVREHRRNPSGKENIPG